MDQMMTIKTDKPACLTDKTDIKLFVYGLVFICLLSIPFLHGLKNLGIGYEQTPVDNESIYDFVNGAECDHDEYQDCKSTVVTSDKNK